MRLGDSSSRARWRNQKVWKKRRKEEKNKKSKLETRTRRNDRIRREDQRSAFFPGVDSTSWARGISWHLSFRLHKEVFLTRVSVRMIVNLSNLMPETGHETTCHSEHILVRAYIYMCASLNIREWIMCFMQLSIFDKWHHIDLGSPLQASWKLM
jgi:hypothetical protein